MLVNTSIRMLICTLFSALLSFIYTDIRKLVPRKCYAILPTITKLLKAQAETDFSLINLFQISIAASTCNPMSPTATPKCRFM